MFLKTLTCLPLVFYVIHIPPASQPSGFSASILRCPNLLGDDVWFLNRLRWVLFEVYWVCLTYLQRWEVVAYLVPAGCKDSLASVGGRDSCTCESPQPEDAQSAMASSLNVVCGDQELTPCLKALSSHCSAQLLQQQAPCQTAPWCIPCSQQCWHTVQCWVPTAACSVWPLFSSPHQFDAIAHVHEKIPELRGLMPNLWLMEKLWTLSVSQTWQSWLVSSCGHCFCSWKGWCSPNIPPNCHETTPSLFVLWLHLFFIHLLEPRPRASAHLLK